MDFDVESNKLPQTTTQSLTIIPVINNSNRISNQNNLQPTEGNITIKPKLGFSIEKILENHDTNVDKNQPQTINQQSQLQHHNKPIVNQPLCIEIKSQHPSNQVNLHDAPPGSINDPLTQKIIMNSESGMPIQKQNNPNIAPRLFEATQPSYFGETKQTLSNNQLTTDSAVAGSGSNSSHPILRDRLLGSNSTRTQSAFLQSITRLRPGEKTDFVDGIENSHPTLNNALQLCTDYSPLLQSDCYSQKYQYHPTLLMHLLQLTKSETNLYHYLKKLRHISVLGAHIRLLLPPSGELINIQPQSHAQMKLSDGAVFTKLTCLNQKLHLMPTISNIICTKP